MTPLRPGGRAVLHAAGLTGDTAAAELICALHTWLPEPTSPPAASAPAPATTGTPTPTSTGNAPSPPSTAISSLLALRSRHPENRGQPRRPPHPRPPRPRPRQPRPHQHRPGHHRHHPRERLTATSPATAATTRAPPGPAEPAAGPSRHPSCPPSVTRTCPTAARNTPWLQAHYRPFTATTRRSASRRGIGTQPLADLPLRALPLARPVTAGTYPRPPSNVPHGSRKSGSRRLYAGHRQANTWAPA